MQRMTKRRFFGGAAALLVVAATLLSMTGAALAANTRDITVSMTTTPVTVNGVTKADISFTNTSGHTLTNAHLLIGLDQVAPLTSGVAIVAVFGGDSAACPAVTDPVTTLDCAFGNIGSKPNQRTRSLSVAFSVGAATSYDIAVEVKVAETGTDVGSNPNFATKTVTVTTTAATCDTLATFLPPGVAKQLTPDTTAGCGSDPQRSSLFVPANANGNVVSIDDSQTAADCAAGYSCFGKAVSASVNNNAPIDPYLTWLIFYSNDTIGNINPKQVGFDHDGTVILPGNKGQCKTDSSVNCQEPYVVSSNGVLFIVRTPSNGLIKGVH